ncbi:MAG: SDR family NAD(P)-dependent oxidoreductase, partial [Flavobacteriaceae bacterium]|nr:SDR family NAD(P)-dependent oxidoreductase [Flavobacteriaceae bacterium]
MRKIIFITGATSGIGKATAHLFAKNGYDVIITGRRKERLLELSKKLKSTHKVDILTLCFDVKNKEEVKIAVASLPNNWKKIDVLLN